MPERISLAPLVKEPIEIEDDEGTVWTCWPSLKGADAIRIFGDGSIITSALRGGPELEWLAKLVARGFRREHREQATAEWVLEHFEPMQIADVVLGFLRQLGRGPSSVPAQEARPEDPTPTAT